MALHLRIENETSLPDGGPIEIRVQGKRGIDIGRDNHLDWTLPDKTRYISSKHCEVRYQDGGYVLYDVSTNGTYLNGHDRRMKGPHKLKTGDRIIIGPYIVLATVDDEPLAAAPTPAANPVATGDLWAASDAPPPIDRRDLDLRKQHKPVQPDYLDWAITPPDIIEDNRTPAAPPRARDPFAQPAPVEPVAAPLPRSAPLPPTLPWNDAPPPLPVNHASPPPLPRESAAPNAAWPPPLIEPVKQAPLAETPMVDHGDAATKALPNVQDLRREGVRAATAPQLSPTSNPRVDPAPANGAGATDLLARFARGSGLESDFFQRQDAGALMEEAGAMMRVMTEGLMAQLAARVEAKRSMRSGQHTMISARDNNPLKFSPTSDEALKILLSPPMRTYLTGQAALRETFTDLQTHQMQIFGAMQQAMMMLFEDLDPGVIDKSVEADRGVASLISSRKAKLWDVFVSRWQAKTHRSELGMVGLFMLYFADCYDHLSQIENERS